MDAVATPSPKDELANALTHALGLALALAGLAALVTLASLRGNARQIVSYSIYGVTLVLLYAASTAYHGVRLPRVKQVLRTLDHIAIYLLIAGTYTPFALVSLRGAWGWSLLGTVWGLALVGIVQEIWLARGARWLSPARFTRAASPSTPPTTNCATATACGTCS